MIYFPFIHKIKKKKNSEPIPLHIEQAPPPPPVKKTEDEKEETERGVVVIELL